MSKGLGVVSILFRETFFSIFLEIFILSDQPFLKKFFLYFFLLPNILPDYFKQLMETISLVSGTVLVFCFFEGILRKHISSSNEYQFECLRLAINFHVKLQIENRKEH